MSLCSVGTGERYALLSCFLSCFIPCILETAAVRRQTRQRRQSGHPAEDDSVRGFGCSWEVSLTDRKDAGDHTPIRRKADSIQPTSILASGPCPRLCLVQRFAPVRKVTFYSSFIAATSCPSSGRRWCKRWVLWQVLCFYLQSNPVTCCLLREHSRHRAASDTSDRFKISNPPMDRHGQL